MIERSIIQATMHGNSQVSRRGMLKSIAVGAGLSGLGFHDLLLAASPNMQKRGKSVIVLWMQGGPSQFETFDPKEGEAGGQNGSIESAIPGVRIAETWPKVAKQMKDITLIRSMTNKEGNHQRATYQLHTGYVPSGSVRHPSFGSLVTSELTPETGELPGFVSIAGPSQGSGFLPVAYGPFRVNDPAKMPANSEITVPDKRFHRRLGLLKKLETGYAKSGAEQQVLDHQGLYRQASKLVTSPKLDAFDISKEPEKVRREYGETAFGNGCLLARRLVDAGVTYVEVQLGNWDTHDDNQNRTKSLAESCDPAFAALVADLKRRGRLDDTLVVWMGEFGRTPRVNPRGGRDHFPRAFNVAVAGGGMRGGTVIGKTSSDGSDVADRPVTVNDLFCTFCKSLGIDPNKENQSPLGRPMKIVDGGTPVNELLV
ncbi:MAG: DUF1501 domain-containing protein [Planctomycetota bacterium]